MISESVNQRSEQIGRISTESTIPRWMDTYMRERLDELDPLDIRLVFSKVFAQLLRGKALEA